MSKLAKFLILSSALVGSQVANAAPADGTYRGLVVASKGLTLNCTLSFEVSGGGTQVGSIGLSGPMCYTWFQNLPYGMTSTGATSGTFAITGIDAEVWVNGGCQGSMTGTWTGATLNIDAVLPPKVAGTGNCTFKGWVQKID